MYGQFFVIIAMILTEYLMRKINFIKKEMNNSLNKLIVYCAYPCMLAYNIGRLRKLLCCVPSRSDQPELPAAGKPWLFDSIIQ